MHARLWVLSFLLTAGATGKPVDYLRDVRPILQEHCYPCHGAEKQKSGYRLDDREVALRGGDSGKPAIVPHNAKASPLLRYVSGEEEEMLMPPAKSGKPRLTASEIETLRSWIDAGPVWPEEHGGTRDRRKRLWSLTPLVKPAVPGEATNPVDGFVGAKLA